MNGCRPLENELSSAGYFQNHLVSHHLFCFLLLKATELKEDRSPSDATVRTTFTILLIDVNDNAPKFNSSEYRVLITELAQVGFALPLFIQAEDKDEVSDSHSKHLRHIKKRLNLMLTVPQHEVLLTKY